MTILKCLRTIFYVRNKEIKTGGTRIFNSGIRYLLVTGVFGIRGIFGNYRVTATIYQRSVFTEVSTITDQYRTRVITENALYRDIYR